jgi:hypothetical protein
MLHELGQLEGYVSEREYPLNHWYLDVAWKRTQTSVPSHIFEVQVKGDLYRAVTKLKHAIEQWNCIAVIVTTDEFLKDAKQVFSSPMHKMNERSKVIDWKAAQELYELALAFKNKKEEIGIEF